MSLHIDNNNTNDIKCKIKNIIWENKGIVLSIIRLLLNNYELIKNKTIIIDNKKMRKIIRKLFKKLSVEKIQNNENNIDEHYLVFNIKNNIKNGVIINNLKNLNSINAKKVILLPFFDPDNPIVMYVHNEKYNIDMDEIKKMINDFNGCDRGKKYGKKNYITSKCNLRTWDVYAEYKILVEYKNKYGASIDYLYDYISKNIMDDMCYENKVVVVPIKVPVKVPVYVPYKVTEQADCSLYENNIKQLLKEIEQLKFVKPNNCQDYIKLMEIFTKKFEVLNDIIKNI